MDDSCAREKPQGSDAFGTADWVSRASPCSKQITITDDNCGQLNESMPTVVHPRRGHRLCFVRMAETANVVPQQNGNNVDERVVRQLEYYFGNINLPKDKFLQDTIKNNEGWVPIKTLLTFNRLAAITKDADVISNAVKESNSEIICLSDDGLKIRRNTNNPLPENSLEYWQQVKHCTVYMKGFEANTTLDEIMDFAKKYGRVENVLMRRTKQDRIFKGSVFVTYRTRAEAEEAQKDDAKFGEIQLTKMMQDDYWTMKNQENKGL
ncbi:hypothetical protein KIN20_028239 [Parelaphostrongylus tenuis]|uniref:Uncharacterized protein n=1 Tax=Parelaphostrongylus tenuis TaxID=148309 RepID=A0AAD5WEU8_PARTN|nr:hypothetical protein KIN20_028239 [Parelaphostrongylus tenuis]